MRFTEKSIIRKTAAVVLAAVLVFTGVFAVSPFSANAEEGFQDSDGYIVIGEDGGEAAMHDSNKTDVGEDGTASVIVGENEVVYEAQSKMVDVTLVVDGTVLNCDSPPKLVVATSRTLIPVRALFEKVGGTVSWDEKKRTVTINYQSHIIVLTIGSTVAYVDGVRKILDQAAEILAGNRTYIPLRFVAENLGFTVGWDAKTMTATVTSPRPVSKGTIKSIGVTFGEKGGTKIVIKSDTALSSSSYKKNVLSDPYRYIIDFTSMTGASAAKGSFGQNSETKYTVSSVRSAQNDGFFRVVFDLRENKTPDISLSSDKKTMTVLFGENFTEEVPVVVKPFEPYADGKLVVCLDPGHGVTTGGKRSPDGTLREYEFNRAVAKKLKAILESKGVKVIMTVSGDEDASLSDRYNLANNSDADIYVSIHANAFGNGEDWYDDITGWEIYYHSSSSHGKVLAQSIFDANKGKIGTKMRGGGPMTYDTLAVLRHTNMPSVLIEHGFFTSRTEVEKLKSDSWRQLCAELDAAGIMNFFAKYK